MVSHYRPFPSDLSDHEWEILAPRIPPAKPDGASLTLKLTLYRG